jgi:Holliday junction resolvase
MLIAKSEEQAGNQFEGMLANSFRQAGWRVRRSSSAGDSGADLILDAQKKKYVVQLKASSEGRRDRLIPLLSQAILEARTMAERFPEPAVPIAVVAAKRIPASVAEQIKQFASRYAPEVGIGVIDAEGLRSFAGHGLEKLDAKPPRRAGRGLVSPQRLPDLFSGLNQWMLKILLGQRLPEALISVPRGPVRNASHLAEIAGVSIMSASRFVHQLANQGFFDDREEHLQVARVEELLELWISAIRPAAADVPARWIIKGGPHQLQASLRKYNSVGAPRCCLGLFAAADALGSGFVQGVPPHIYLESLTLDSLERLGLTAEHSDRAAAVYIRVPANREAIFRSAVRPGGFGVSDILQVWLDVSTHPARGREQAREIWRRVLKPAFGKQG